MPLQIQDAIKYRLPARVCIWGTPKAGKTHGALELAHSLVPGGKIGVISTEFASSMLLRHRFPHTIVNLAEVDENGTLVKGAFSPSRYEEAIRLFNYAHYDVIVIDSLSHLYEGEGGILEMASQGQNTFTDGWGKATPAYKKVINLILSSRCHIIVTLRAKEEYRLEEYVKKNNQIGFIPKNIGMSPIIRKGFGFEMQLTLRMDSMVAHAEATAMQDYIARGAEFENLGTEFAQLLLSALDGEPPPEPSQQQKDMRLLFDEFYSLFTATCIKNSNWEKLLLQKAIGSIPSPTEYTDEHVERVRQHIERQKREKEVREAQLQ